MDSAKCAVNGHKVIGNRIIIIIIMMMIIMIIIIIILLIMIIIDPIQKWRTRGTT